MEGTDVVRKFRDIVKYIVRSLGIYEKSEAYCCGTTLAQCNAIIEIGRAKEISLIDLADILNLDTSTASRTVNNLVSQNLVVREEDPEDRRYLKIKLTKEGEKIYKTVEESMDIFFKKVYESIPADKREQVMESLGILLNALKENKCC
ncbi:MarR family winged helix-turn-helix transcriptional regulator [Thermovenabulum gondwanense]|uniref:HTH marR-type domain-containing protein n=1 Tax=Thermovenabulum gondwanense TaxID=520767 RepID=A0A162MF40_9FIRM|nr:MarR family transcriptional regulator [Thermovenabulum gondwanense]KYO65528.1 hypothetical protein ATZ99_15640 [Thermovenabulum gondwanense]